MLDRMDEAPAETRRVRKVSLTAADALPSRADHGREVGEREGARRCRPATSTSAVSAPKPIASAVSRHRSHPCGSHTSACVQHSQAQEDMRALRANVRTRRRAVQPLGRKARTLAPDAEGSTRVSDLPSPAVRQDFASTVWTIQSQGGRGAGDHDGRCRGASGALVRVAPEFGASGCSARSIRRLGCTRAVGPDSGP